MPERYTLSDSPRSKSADDDTAMTRSLLSTHFAVVPMWCSLSTMRSFIHGNHGSVPMLVWVHMIACIGRVVNMMMDGDGFLMECHCTIMAVVDGHWAWIGLLVWFMHRVMSSHGFMSACSHVASAWLIDVLV